MKQRYKRYIRVAAFILSVFVCSQSTHAAVAEEFKDWSYYADVAVQTQVDDSYDSVYADFTHLLQRDLKAKSTFDERSVRVALLKDNVVEKQVPSRFVKGDGYDAETNAAGIVVFAVPAEPEGNIQKFRVFFDVTENSVKPLPEDSTGIPDAANMVWNGGFEILSEGYKGPNRYKNTGKNLPRGWWGNLRNRKISENLSREAHSGQHALSFVVQEEEGQKNTGIRIAPSAPGIRVQPGQSYLFSYWVRGEDLVPSRTSVLSATYWLDEAGKTVAMERIGGLPTGIADFPWTYVEDIRTAPAGALSVAMTISTYSTTGLVTVDDLAIRPIVPPLLVEAQPNR